MDAPSEENKTGAEEVRQFEDAARQSQPGLIAELMGFLRHNKKWWLTPILVVLLVLGLLVILAGTPAGLAIYTLF